MPGNAVSVLEPAALLRLLVSAFRELLPVVVDLFLCLARDLEGDRLVESERRAAVECGKQAPVEFKCHGQNSSRRLSVDYMPCFAIPGSADEPGVLKDSG